MKKRIALSIAALVGLLLVFSGIQNTYGQDAGPVVVAPVDDTADGIGTSPSIPDPGTDPGGFFQSMVSAAKAGQWRLLAACFLVGLVWAARKWGSRFVPWLKTDRGGAVLVLCASLLLSVSTWLSGGGDLDLGLLFDALAMACTAAGAYSMSRRLTKPKDGGVIVTSPVGE